LVCLLVRYWFQFYLCTHTHHLFLVLQLPYTHTPLVYFAFALHTRFACVHVLLVCFVFTCLWTCARPQHAVTTLAPGLIWFIWTVGLANTRLLCTCSLHTAVWFVYAFLPHIDSFTVWSSSLVFPTLHTPHMPLPHTCHPRRYRAYAVRARLQVHATPPFPYAPGRTPRAAHSTRFTALPSSSLRRAFFRCTWHASTTLTPLLTTHLPRNGTPRACHHIHAAAWQFPAYTAGQFEGGSPQHYRRTPVLLPVEFTASTRHTAPRFYRTHQRCIPSAHPPFTAAIPAGVVMTVHIRALRNHYLPLFCRFPHASH